MRVLIAEDDKTTRIRLKSYLENMGHGVVVAQDGAEAWEIFENGEFSFVLTDWIMPNVDGLELVRRIRSSSGNGYVYVVLLTSKSDKKDVVDGMEAGADDFLSKPFDKDELRVRIAAGERIIELEQSLERRNRELEEERSKLANINSRMMTDLIAAAEVQHAFLPEESPNYSDASFEWYFKPCDELAGDMLNVVPLDDQHIGIYVLDVSGHGVRAALLAVTLNRMLSLDSPSVLREPIENTSDYRICSPSEVASRLNQQFNDIEATSQYFTMMYGILNLETNHFRFSCAGHPPPILLSRKSEPKTVEASGLPIGIMETDYDEHSLTLHSGDRLYIFSDGVTETIDLDENLFGTDRLMEELGKTQAQPLRESISNITDRLAAWRGEGPVTDDVSILALEIV